MEAMKSAISSSCGLYRYDLRRDWDANLPPLVLGMLNPSKADHKIDDPTIVRGVYRAKTMNCGSLIVWNLGAGRATEPQDWMAMPDPIGPDNDRHIRDILTECKERNGIAVAGWGVYGDFMNRDLAAMEIAHTVQLPGSRGPVEQIPDDSVLKNTYYRVIDKPSASSGL